MHVYARNQAGRHVYARNQAGRHVYARNQAGRHVYARNQAGRHVYARNQAGTCLCEENILKRFVDGMLGCISVCPVECLSNALKLEIYFKELDYQQIVTSPSYEVADLLADLGGQAGLWLGVSVIAFFEFFELLYDVVSVAVVRQISLCCPNRGRTSPVESF
ncbi:hypothetical protein LSAT2_009066 [Lamellibrachia satsuma]|nr:hypothetical protein LSAT2_009066 [Lamellibrachia satsuma]